MAAREALSSRQRIRRDPRETVSRRHARLHHGSRKMPIIAADSILQGEVETISRRHERGCVLSGRGRAYHGVTRDSLCPIEAGEPIMAARVIRCLSCHEGRLYHGGKRASMSIVAAGIDWQHCPAGMPWGLGSVVISWIVVCGHVLNGSVIMSWVCDHFVACGLWSCPGWVCGHLLGLWSFPGSWSVVMSWVCGNHLGLW